MRLLGVSPVTYTAMRGSSLARLVNSIKSREGFNSLENFKYSLNEYLKALDKIEITRFDPSNPDKYKNLLRRKIEANKSNDSVALAQVELELSQLPFSVREVQGGKRISEEAMKVLYFLISEKYRVEDLLMVITEFLDTNTYGLPKYFRRPSKSLYPRSMMRVLAEYKDIEKENAYTQKKEYLRYQREVTRLLSDLKASKNSITGVAGAFKVSSIVSNEDKRDIIEGETMRNDIMLKLKNLSVPNLEVLKIIVDFLQDLIVLEEDTKIYTKMGIDFLDFNKVAKELSDLGVYWMYYDNVSVAIKEVLEKDYFIQASVAEIDPSVEDMVHLLRMDLDSKIAGGVF